MKTIIHHAEERGAGEYEWLSTRYSFSFANWYNPARMGFGALLVLNDDTIAPGQGFGAHSHDNMEILTIVRKGTLAHKDSIGTEGIIHAEEVQVMSAGTGVTHSEFNASTEEPLSLFQIWIQTDSLNAEPRYDQRNFRTVNRTGFVSLVSPLAVSVTEATLGIHQDAYITQATLTPHESLEYALKNENHGVYVFVMSGSATVNDITLHERDALAISETPVLILSATTPAELLLIEIPLA
jgi:redox-sensitive bicupin YhaK (pirin superfamily)